jgi:nucleotide-binding universal stress UspA family protein
MTGITRILVPTDFSATSDVALRYGRQLAEQVRASLHLVHAFEDPYATASFAAEMYSPLPLTLREDMIRDIRQKLAGLLAGDQGAPPDGTAEIVTGPAAGAIVDYAKSVDADLIVIGTHGRGGVAHLVLGSVAERVVRTAACPVLTVRQTHGTDIRRILVPTDFSATADDALDSASWLAERFGAALQLLHVLDDPSVAGGLAAEAYIAEAPTMRTALLRDAQSRLAHRATSLPSNVRAASEVLFGRGAATIADYAAARDIDLIVMGTHGRTGLTHLLLGSVAERVVRTAPCPVLTIRHVAPAKARAELTYDIDHLPA